MGLVVILVAIKFLSSFEGRENTSRIAVCITGEFQEHSHMQFLCKSSFLNGFHSSVEGLFCLEVNEPGVK